MCECVSRERERERVCSVVWFKGTAVCQTHCILRKQGFYKSQCCVLLKCSHLSFYCCTVALSSGKHGHCECVCVWRAGHYITVWWKTGGDKLGVLGGGGTSIIRELHRERKRYGK